jgi:hypothetical protein
MPRLQRRACLRPYGITGDAFKEEKEGIWRTSFLGTKEMWSRKWSSIDLCYFVNFGLTRVININRCIVPIASRTESRPSHRLTELAFLFTQTTRRLPPPTTYAVLWKGATRKLLPSRNGSAYFFRSLPIGKRETEKTIFFLVYLCIFTLSWRLDYHQSHGQLKRHISAWTGNPKQFALLPVFLVAKDTRTER